MRGDATLIVNEYVGANRFQYSDDVLAIMNGLLRCHRHTESLGIGHPNILDRHAHNTPSNIERIFSPREHTSEPVERSVRVTITHRLMQGRNRVIVQLATFIVCDMAPLKRLKDLLRR